MSFLHSHIGDQVRDFRSYGRNAYLIEFGSRYVLSTQRRLACLHACLREPVWAFHVCHELTSFARLTQHPADDFMLRTTVADLSDLWGPVGVVYARDETSNHPQGEARQGFTTTPQASRIDSDDIDEEFDTTNQRIAPDNLVIELHIGEGVLMQVNGTAEASKASDEVSCHWYSRLDYQELQSQDRQGFSIATPLFIGMRSARGFNPAARCPRFQDYERTVAGEPFPIGTADEKYDTHGRALQVGIAKIVGVNLILNQIKNSAVHMRYVILSEWLDRLRTDEVATPDTRWSTHMCIVQVSSCSGNARRRTLSEFLGHQDILRYVRLEGYAELLAEYDNCFARAWDAQQEKHKRERERESIAVLREGVIKVLRRLERTGLEDDVLRVWSVGRGVDIRDIKPTWRRLAREERFGATFVAFFSDCWHYRSRVYSWCCGNKGTETALLTQLKLSRQCASGVPIKTCQDLDSSELTHTRSRGNTHGRYCHQYGMERSSHLYRAQAMRQAESLPKRLKAALSPCHNRPERKPMQLYSVCYETSCPLHSTGKTYDMQEKEVYLRNGKGKVSIGCEVSDDLLQGEWESFPTYLSQPMWLREVAWKFEELMYVPEDDEGHIFAVKVVVH